MSTWVICITSGDTLLSLPRMQRGENAQPPRPLRAPRPQRALPRRLRHRLPATQQDRHRLRFFTTCRSHQHVTSPFSQSWRRVLGQCRSLLPTHTHARSSTDSTPTSALTVAPSKPLLPPIRPSWFRATGAVSVSVVGVVSLGAGLQQACLPPLPLPPPRVAVTAHRINAHRPRRQSRSRLSRSTPEAGGASFRCGG